MGSIRIIQIEEGWGGLGLFRLRRDGLIKIIQIEEGWGGLELFRLRRDGVY